MATTSIEWTQTVWNPTTGCSMVSEGCRFCYAVSMTKRLEAMGNQKYSGLVNVGKGHFNGVVRCHEDELMKPFSWKKPRRVFVNSMSDIFHKEVPFDFINEIFAVMALCPQHTFQILTKRPERMAEYFWGWRRKISLILPDPRPIPNVWLGTSCEDQAAADERIPRLLECPAAVRFLSCEPLLGEIDLGPFLYASCVYCDGAGTLDPRTDDDCRFCGGTGYSEAFPLDELHWVIVGGESGPGARPCKIDHVRSIVRQCQAAQVPVFVKQLGARPVGGMGDAHIGLGPKGGNFDAFPEDLRVREYPTKESEK